MAIESSGEIRLRGAAGDGRTDINEEINGNATDTDVSLGTLNTSAFTNVSDGSTISGRSMSEMYGYQVFAGDPFYPTTEATGALGESMLFSGNAYNFYRVPTISSNRTTFTYSGWYKFNDDGIHVIFESGPTDGNGYISLRIDGGSNNEIYGLVGTNPGNPWLARSSERFLDFSSWYHFVFAVDTTKSYINDRLRVYVNGIEIKFNYTANSIAQNQTFYINDGSSRISFARTARTDQYAQYSQAVIADAKFIDGQQLRPDSFGQMKNGIWVPKAFNTPSTDTLVTSNLLANYQLNGNANDETGNYNGVNSNNTYLSTNYGVANFNGSNARIYTNSTFLNLQSFSASAWVNFDSISSTRTFVGAYEKNPQSSGDSGWLFRYSANAGGINFGYNTGGVWYNKTISWTPDLNKWYHVSLTRNSNGDLKFYIDGTQYGSTQSTTGTINYSWGGTTSTFTIGGVLYYNTFYDGMDGSIGEAQAYSSVLTSTEILQNYNATKHKYAYGLNGFHLPLNNTSAGTIVDDTSLKLHLDASNSSSYGGSGTTWSDLTTNNNDGTISGASFLSSTNGGVFDFDGTNDSISLGATNTALPVNDKVSIEMWFNTDTMTASGHHNGKLMCNSDGGSFSDGEFQIGFYDGGIYADIGGGANSSVYRQRWWTTDIAINKWYHLVLTFDSNTTNVVECYINGFKDTVANTLSGGTFSGNLFNSTFVTHIGKRNISGNENWFNGKIAQVRAYNKVLTAQEVIQNYRATQGNYEQVSTVDISGNANSFTATNLDYTNHIKDQPAENYATWNPNDNPTGNLTFSNGNLKVVASSTWGGTSATLGVSSGKWYYEAKITQANTYSGTSKNTTNGAYLQWGFITKTGLNSYSFIAGSGLSDSIIICDTGTFGINSSITSPNYGQTQINNNAHWAVNDVIGLALDADTGVAQVYKNGSALGSSVTLSADIYVPFVIDYPGEGEAIFNFGAKGFDYTPPTGYKALATHNLPNAQFDPKDSEQNKDYFKAVTYQGNGGTQGEAYGIVDGSKAAVFNGSSSYIRATGLGITGNTAFSVSTWINTTSSGIYFFFGDGNATGSLSTIINASFFINVNSNGTVTIGEMGFDVFTSTTTVNDGSWHNIIFTSNGTNSTLYIDGVQSNTTTNTFNIGTDMLEIGRATSSYYFNGKIDQVRVFNRELLTNNNGVNEISNLYDEQDLTATTRSTTDIFSDGSGVALYELNGDSLDTGGASGKFGSGAIIDNSSNKYITFPNIPNVLTNTSNDDFAISIWFNLDSIPSSSSTYYTLFGKGNPTTSANYQMLYGILRGTSNTDEVQFEFRRGYSGATYDAITYNIQKVLSANTWYHLVLSYTASNKNLVIYINNTNEGTDVISSASTGRTIESGFNIGSYRTGTTGFPGKVDQFRIFNKALSTNNNGVNEINELYTESGTDLSTTDILGDGSGVALYQLDGDATDSSGAIVATTVTLSGGSTSYAYANASASSGKYYWEVKVITNGYGSGSTLMAGVANTSTPSGGWQSGNNYFYYANNGYKYSNGGSSAYGSTWQQGYIIGVALDLDNDTLTFYNNNSSQGQAYSGLTGSYYPAFATGLYADVAQFIFDSNDWTYSAPAGYSEWTAAKTASIVTGNGAATTQVTYDGTETNILYAYNGTASNVTYTQDKPYGNINVGFKPDFVWIRKRSNDTKRGRIFDSVRGAGKVIYDSLNNIETTVTDELTSFDSNGFTLGSASAVNDGADGDTYVAWAWKAAGFKNDFNVIDSGTLTTSNSNTTAGITAGTITNGWSVSANRDTGFSIVSYTGNGQASQTVGTGLSKAAQIMIVKNLDDSTDNWQAFGGSLFERMQFNLDGPDDNNYPVVFNTDTVLLPQENSQWGNVSWNGNNDRFISYFWHSVDGFSKINSYVGNGSTSGPFVYTGFKPTWVMVKRLDVADHWAIYDNARGVDNMIAAQTNAVEYTSRTEMAFYSNGFKLTGGNAHVNASGGNYLYMAFAEDPFTTSNAVIDSGKKAIGDGNEFIEDGNYPEDNFSTTTYTGNGGTQKIVTGYKPDLVWIKQRTLTEASGIFDSVRGADLWLRSSTSDAQNNFGGGYGVTSFDSNGFTLGNGSAVNGNGYSMVAWSWKAAGNANTYNILENGVTTATANAADLDLGTYDITPTGLSANRDAGFSIVTIDGTTNGGTIPHGLSKPPELIIKKRYSHSSNWMILHDVEGFWQLNEGFSTSASTNYSSYVKNIDNKILDLPFSADWSTGTSNKFIYYCWHSVPGYSKIGMWNGGTTSIYTGFEPAFILFHDFALGGGWAIMDNKRNSGSTIKYLLANSDAVEANTTWPVFTSDGFTVASEISSVQRLYMAFAHR